MAGPNGGPRVSIYNGQTIASGAPMRLIGDFFAFEPTLRNGAYATIGDFDGDGFGDLVLGAGLGGAPRVRIISGAELLKAQSFTTLDSIVGVSLANFIAGDVNSRSGIRVTVKDVEQRWTTGPCHKQRSQPSERGSDLSRRRLVDESCRTRQCFQIFDPFNLVLPEGVFVG